MSSIDSQLLNKDCLNKEEQEKVEREITKEKISSQNNVNSKKDISSKENRKRVKGNINNSKNKINKTVVSPFAQGEKNIMRWMWASLIPSFGLSLIYINLHVLLGMIVGKKFFCKLGEEWIPETVLLNMGESGEKSVGLIRIIEPMGLVLLDLLVGTAIFLVISMIVFFVTTNFWEKGIIYIKYVL